MADCLCNCHKVGKLCGMCCKDALHKPSEAEDKSKKGSGFAPEGEQVNGWNRSNISTVQRACGSGGR